MGLDTLIHQAIIFDRVRVIKMLHGRAMNQSQKCVLVAEEAHSYMSRYAASRLREVLLLLDLEVVRHI